MIKAKFLLLLFKNKKSKKKIKREIEGERANICVLM